MSDNEPKITHIGDLTPDPNNARLHNPRNVGMIADGLGKVGAARSIVIDEHGVILAGNATIEAAAQAGIENVTVVPADGETIIAVQRIGLTDEQKKRLALYDNRTAELATWNPEQLLADLDAGVELGDLWYEGEIEELLADVREPEPVADPGAQVDRAAELQVEWGTERGQIWEIPSASVPGRSHRVMCGDSTDAGDVARLMDGEKANMVFTDPPYNVSIVGGAHDPRDSKNYGTGPRIQNDSMPDGEFDAFLASFLENIYCVLKDGGSYYLCSPDGRIQTQFRNALNKRFRLRQCIIWVKQQMVFGRQDYHWRHESILYGWKDGAAHYFTSDKTQDTVWNIDRPLRSEKEHPTMKPIELVARAIGNSSKTGELVLDPFLGSGTTLIAAESCGRICYGIEIDPGYCGVILQRASDMGLRATLTKAD